MNRCISFLALSLVLHASLATSMQQTNPTSLTTLVKNSSVFKWMNQNKIPLILGGAGLTAATVTYLWYKVPTPKQIKETIRSENQMQIIQAAQYIKNGILTGSIQTVSHPHPYEVIISPIQKENGIIGARAHFHYKFDNTEEIVEITFENEPRVSLFIKMKSLFYGSLNIGKTKL